MQITVSHIKEDKPKVVVEYDGDNMLLFGQYIEGGPTELFINKTTYPDSEVVRMINYIRQWPHGIKNMSFDELVKKTIGATNEIQS